MTQFDDLIDRLEPDLLPKNIRFIDEGTVLSSIAISLKRIADALDTGEGRDPLAVQIVGGDEDEDDDLV